jgi:hypothetical protein
MQEVHECIMRNSNGGNWWVVQEIISQVSLVKLMSCSCSCARSCSTHARVRAFVLMFVLMPVLILVLMPLLMLVLMPVLVLALMLTLAHALAHEHDYVHDHARAHARAHAYSSRAHVHARMPKTSDASTRICFCRTASLCTCLSNRRMAKSMYG